VRIVCSCPAPLSNVGGKAHIDDSLKETKTE
jgi:hypothetical protein